MSKPFDIAKRIRPEVTGFEPYLPGRSMESVRKAYGLKSITKLASNENAWGPSPKAKRVLSQGAIDVLRYPDGASTQLRQTIAQKTGVDISRVFVGAGSDEIIEILGKTFLTPGDSIVVSEHAFIRYQMAGDLMGARVVRVPMQHFTHDLAAMARAVTSQTKIVFIANPNNPTGTANGTPELVGMLERIEQESVSPLGPPIVVVDEAYFDYARVWFKEYPNSIALQERFPFLMTLRTFSKAHALAGLRVGYGVAAPAVIQALDRVRPPFNVNHVAQRAAAASLEDTSFIKRVVRQTALERDKMIKALKKMGVSFVPSVGNFLLIDVSPQSGQAVFEALLKKGMIVRAMAEYGFQNHIRVTFGKPDENIRFLRIFQEVVRS